MKAYVIQRASFTGENKGVAASIEFGGVLFFSVTPQSSADAEKINDIFRDAVIRPKGLTFHGQPPRSLTDKETLKAIADIVGKSCDEDEIMAAERVLASATKQLQKADAENLRLREDMEAAQTAFVILREKWITPENRQDSLVRVKSMNEAMDALSEAFRSGSLNEEIDGFVPCPHCGRDPESATCHCKPEEDFE